MHKHFGSTAVSRSVRVVSLLALGFAALGSPQPARALGIIIGVSTETDELTPNAVCSLREAVYVASNPGDTTYPECGTGVGNDSIETGPGPYILTMNQPLEPAADMRFYGDEELGTIIEASDCDPTPASPGCTPADFPVFSITTPSITVSMQDLSIQYGYATGASGDGGGIHNENATLHLSLVQVIHNRAGGNGGGIYNDGGTVNLDSTGVGSNVADAGAGGESGGGGIFNNSGTVTLINNSDVGAYPGGNTATTGQGGGIHNLGGILSISNSTVANNVATVGDGGGIYDTGTRLAVDHSSINNNSASGSVSGLGGGGIWSSDSLGTIDNTTIGANSATSGAGGLYHSGGTMLIKFTTIYGNEGTTADGLHAGSSIELSNSLLGRNGTTGPVDCSGSLSVNDHNLIQNNSCGGSPITTDPGSMTLGQNLGLTLSYALPPSSLAVNAADDAACPVDDQRNVSRPRGAHCDIGSFELLASEFRCYVDANAGGANTGANWTDAYTDLQSALVRSECREVHVAEGTYYPDGASPGSQAYSFQILPGVEVYGGYPTGGGTRDFATHVTVLSGDIDRATNPDTNKDSNGVTPTADDIVGNNSLHVVYMDGTTATGNITEATVLDGFTVSGGNATASQGGGLWCAGGGAGFECSPAITNVTFSGNQALAGGAIYNSGLSSGASSPTITNVTFGGNKATSFGGAIYNDGRFGGDSSPSLINAAFYNNQAPYGGALYNDGSGTDSASSPGMINVTFNNNQAQYGGAMYNDGTSAGASNPTLANTILWGDTASSSGSEIYNNTATPGIYFSLVEGGDSGSNNGTAWTDGASNLDADPLFVDAGIGDLHLQQTSPAVDAGANGLLPSSITTDLDGNARFVDIPSAPDTGNGTAPIVDMGAYEAVPGAAILHVQTDGTSLTCTDWGAANACQLQHALAIAAAGDQIWVEAGAYRPTTYVDASSRSVSFVLRSGVEVYGGFGGTETQLTDRGLGFPTVLSGDIGVSSDASDNSYHVVDGGGVDSTALLDGFTIQYGNADGAAPDSFGGGMYNSASSPRLSNLTFRLNNAGDSGGGIYNTAGSSPTLTAVTFDSNTAVNSGAGMFNDSCDPTLANVTFYNNQLTAVTGQGGGMLNFLSSPDLTNVTFSANYAQDSGGAMFNENGVPVIKNSIFWGNGDEMLNSGGAVPDIADSVVAGGCPAGASCTNVIDADPMLGPLQNSNGYTPTMALLAGSAAINSGDDTICGNGAGSPDYGAGGVDQRGVTRPYGEHCDIGAFEAELPYRTAADFDGNQTSNVVVYSGGAWQFYDFGTGAYTGGVWTGDPGGSCIPAPMDYKGNGVVEFTQLCGPVWHFYNADGSYNKGIWTGLASGVPVPGDYNGDGTDDPVVFDGGAWQHYDFATGLYDAAHSVWTGLPGGAGIPAAMDYDGDGSADPTILADSGAWHFYNDDGSYNKGIWIGIGGAIPVPADYSGDGTEQPVVFAGGAWQFYDFATGLYDAGSSVWTGAPAPVGGGVPNPAPLDYNGDGMLDFTYYAGGAWHFYNDNGSYNKGVWTGGAAGDLPISRRQVP